MVFFVTVQQLKHYIPRTESQSYKKWCRVFIVTNFISRFLVRHIYNNAFSSVFQLGMFQKGENNIIYVVKLCEFFMTLKKIHNMVTYLRNISNFILQPSAISTLKEYIILSVCNGRFFKC